MLTRSFANKIGLFFILTDNYFKITVGSFDFHMQYVFFLIYIVYYVLVIRVVETSDKGVLQLITLLIFLSLAPLLNPAGLGLFLKQLILIGLNFVFSYLLINAYKFDFEKIFKDYIELIYYASVVAVIQGISLIFGFKPGADFSWLGFEMGNFNMLYTRVQSWFEEPSVMTLSFLPVIFICVARFFNMTDMISTGRALFILVIFLLTQSSTGLIGLVLCMVIIVLTKYPVLRKPHLLVGGLFALTIVSLLLYSIPLVKLRVDDTAALFFKRHVTSEDINKTNHSTYSLYSNYAVARMSLMEHPVLGSGLGTHELNYDSYIYLAVPKNRLGDEAQLNKKDAAGLLLRIASELGFAGLVLSCWLLFHYRIKLSGFGGLRHSSYWLMSNAIFVLIVTRMMRQGHYTMLGFILFLLIYLFLRKADRVDGIERINNEAISA